MPSSRHRTTRRGWPKISQKSSLATTAPSKRLAGPARPAVQLVAAVRRLSLVGVNTTENDGSGPECSSCPRAVLRRQRGPRVAPAHREWRPPCVAPALQYVLPPPASVHLPHYGSPRPRPRGR